MISAARYLSIIWPVSLFTEGLLAIALLGKIRVRPWFSAYILFDVGRSIVVYAISMQWSTMLADSAYCRMFLRMEWPALAILSMAVLEGCPASVRSAAAGIAIMGGGAVVAVLTLAEEKLTPRGIPAMAARVWIDCIFLACSFVKFPEQDRHGWIMCAFLGSNCIAYGSLLLFHPGDSTQAACLTITADALCYLAWAWKPLCTGYRFLIEFLRTSPIVVQIQHTIEGASEL